MAALNLDLDKDLLWKAKALVVIRKCCVIAGMPDVTNNVLIEFCDAKRTTMGTAWTHYGPHKKYPKFYKGSKKNPHPLYPLRGKPRGGAIKFAIELFERADEAECLDTIIHEIAHILANLKARRNVAHSDDWREMMRFIGAPFGIFKIARCHSVDTTGLKRRNRRFLLRCPKHCGWKVRIASARRTRRINQISRRTHLYSCPECGANLSAQHYRDLQEIPR